MEFNLPEYQRREVSLETITVGTEPVIFVNPGTTTVEHKPGVIKRLGDLKEEYQSLAGIAQALGAYIGVRYGAQFVMDPGVVRDAVIPVAAASLASLIGHQKTPNGIARYVAVTMPPLLA